MVAVTRSQTKCQKVVHEIRGEDFPLPWDILVKVAKQLKTGKDELSLFAFSMTCKHFKEVKDEVGRQEDTDNSDAGETFRRIYCDTYQCSTVTF